MVGELADAIHGYAVGEPLAQENLVKTLRALVVFYPSHIWKEDYLLFPMTNKILSDGEQEALSQGFKQHESPIGLDVHHGFEQLAEKIVAKAHVEEDASSALSAA